MRDANQLIVPSDRSLLKKNHIFLTLRVLIGPHPVARCNLKHRRQDGRLGAISLFSKDSSKVWELSWIGGLSPSITCFVPSGFDKRSPQ